MSPLQLRAVAARCDASGGLRVWHGGSITSKPYGSDRWTKLAATTLGLQSTLRPRGRPRKTSKK